MQQYQVTDNYAFVTVLVKLHQLYTKIVILLPQISIYQLVCTKLRDQLAANGVTLNKVLCLALESLI